MRGRNGESGDEQSALKRLTHKGRVAARRLTRAHILQMAHDKQTDEQIADALKTSVPPSNECVNGSSWVVSILPCRKNRAQVRPAN
jgi:hypothetical protein